MRNMGLFRTETLVKALADFTSFWAQHGPLEDRDTCESLREILIDNQIWANGLFSAKCGRSFSTRIDLVAQIWANGLCSGNFSRSCRTRVDLGAQN